MNANHLYSVCFDFLIINACFSQLHLQASFNKNGRNCRIQETLHRATWIFPNNSTLLWKEEHAFLTNTIHSKTYAVTFLGVGREKITAYLHKQLKGWERPRRIQNSKFLKCTILCILGFSVVLFVHQASFQLQFGNKLQGHKEPKFIHPSIS